MFVDSVSIFIASGHGGAGAVSFRREKFVIQGGPDGGDGGRGGDVYFLVDKNTSTLANFRGHKKYVAGNGAPGEGKNRNGKKGNDMIIKVPPGTQVINQKNNEILLDLINDVDKIKILSGGKGGLGNSHFKNSTNQAPTYAQKGLAGEELNINLELKLIADVALVGFPNVGKSSLISTITNSKPKIANYEFTTLIPNLGVVDIDDFNSFVMADIPGLIQGASLGRGLGLQFLQHIERTKLLLFMLDVSFFDFNIESNPQYKTMFDSIDCTDTEQMVLKKQLCVLQYEIMQYSHILANRPYAIALTKSDVILHENFMDLKFHDNQLAHLQSPIYISNPLKDFMEHGIKITIEKENDLTMSNPLFVVPISSATNLNLDILKSMLFFSLKSLE